MSRKNRRARKTRQKPVARKQTLSSQQAVRLQRAMHAQSTGNLAFAESEYRALIADKAKTPQLFCNLAAICAQSGRRNEADRLWKEALAMDPQFLEAQMNLADSYQLAGAIEQAGKTYRRVLAHHEHFIPARYMLGNMLKSQGKLEEAAKTYQDVLARQPEYTQAHFTYSGIHRYEDHRDPHLNQMRDLYQRPDLSADSKVHLAFALAKACEDVGDYDQAFAYLDTGNALRARDFHYDISSDRALIDNIIQIFSKDAMSKLNISAADSDRPIFIVGMPRSGTSLVEKILASHTKVYGAGELETMFALGTSRFLRQAGHFEYRPLDAYPATVFASVGTDYLEKIALLNDDARHVTDKMPFNMMMTGLISIALPNAKIVHCVRGAEDTCLSIFKQNFTTGNYRFAYNQKTVAQFYNEYRKLMQHWHASLPGKIYDVSYESLTRNPEHEIRQLLAACDLDFQEACVTFEKTEAIVSTASAYQVRQPMYTSSVGLWRKYEAFLEPMIETLKDGGNADHP